ncbi:MAG: MBL fold metallo-hydrolase [Treponemataceae bacterium]
MRVKFWGVRGSLPSPVCPESVFAKIQSVVQRISVRDLENEESRENFVASLPPWLCSTVGGNSSCVELRICDDEVFILDAGSGIRELGIELVQAKIKKIHIFFSHFHWDHIQGLPFFEPLFKDDCEIHFYSPMPFMKEVLSAQMKYPVFPVDFESGCKSRKFFHKITENEAFEVCGVIVNSRKIEHPGKCFAYSFLQKNGKKLIFATDCELSLSYYEKNEAIVNFFSNTDVIIMDGQYLVHDAILRENWGHSAFCYAIDFANHWKIGTLFIFHYDPQYSDRTLYSLFDKAVWYVKNVISSKIKIELAKEHDSFDL